MRRNDKNGNLSDIISKIIARSKRREGSLKMGEGRGRRICVVESRVEIFFSLLLKKCIEQVKNK